ncbi:acyltransferase family protein [Sphingobacterium corticibacter]|uniref:Acyltransferase 3 domain-containing protein n=1 Tax=Sphingobacterium corticibacter TaxID=2171749 RepID=A0A2T8HEW3_9SPHI|nr:acyltransferase family protein [Sphingobacterium corticibacter]PVH23955.1 hypothetical protein DC487_16010 [Sphingobacterium corticibacter]
MMIDSFHSSAGLFTTSFCCGSLLLLVLLFVPRLGGDDAIWMNGVYETFVITVMFPLIIYIGASAVSAENVLSTVCKFLGDLSYPIYITHFPIIYLYSAWISDHRGESDFQLWTVVYGLLTFGLSIALGYAALKCYDEPVRKYIRRKIFVSNQ